MAKNKVRKAPKSIKKLPIEHWSHSSLMSFLRNPLAWHKRYVEKIYDTPSGPAGVIGRAGHKALEHYYSGADKETATRLGLEYLRNVPDFEINFGIAKSLRAKKAKRIAMEKDYLQAVGFYLARAPRHKVLGVEVSGVARVPGHSLPLKAISDLVVESRTHPGYLDIVDHKFVDSFSKSGSAKPLFIMQSIFNYYTVSEQFERPVARFVVYECKKRKNKDGSSQMRKHVLDYKDAAEYFEVFRRLINDATAELKSRKVFLPNPSDMFEGEDSFEVYKLRLIGD